MKVFSLSLCIIISITHAQTSVWDSFTGTIAVVEFQREIEGPHEVFHNIQKYWDVVLTLKTNVDMIIFPELSFGVSPETSTEINLGDKAIELGKYPEYLRVASGLAFNYQTYIVTNIVEKVKCEDPSKDQSQNCRNNGTYFYNTDVVFDRNGTIIAKYRKYNLFGEKHLDTPQKPEIVTFQTDFGIKFGIFTCFDILFKNPGQDLMKSQVDGVVFPTNWHSELPFLTALQSQQMWAYAYNTTLFAAGGNQPDASSGGTAVYRGRRDTVVSALVASGGTQTLLFESVNGEVTTSSFGSVDDLGEEMDAFPIMVDDSLKDYKYLPLDTSKNSVQEQLCYHSEDTNTHLCCNFNITLTNNPVEDNFYFYTYLLVAYAGVRVYPDVANAGLEVCGAIACLNSSISSCGRRFPKYGDVQWPLTFEELRISAVFDYKDDNVQFPNSLLGSVRPIEASETEWTGRNFVENGNEKLERTFEITRAQNRILTFAIYGRNFAYDSFPEDNSAASSTRVALWVMICSFVLSTV